jgi:hypothetical protein
MNPVALGMATPAMIRHGFIESGASLGEEEKLLPGDTLLNMDNSDIFQPTPIHPQANLSFSAKAQPQESPLQQELILTVPASSSTTSEPQNSHGLTVDPNIKILQEQLRALQQQAMQQQQQQLQQQQQPQIISSLAETNTNSHFGQLYLGTGSLLASKEIPGTAAIPDIFFAGAEVPMHRGTSTVGGSSDDVFFTSMRRTHQPQGQSNISDATHMKFRSKSSFHDRTFPSLSATSNNDASRNLKWPSTSSLQGPTVSSLSTSSSSNPNNNNDTLGQFRHSSASLSSQFPPAHNWSISSSDSSNITEQTRTSSTSSGVSRAAANDALLARYLQHQLERKQSNQHQDRQKNDERQDKRNSW